MFEVAKPSPQDRIELGNDVSKRPLRVRPVFWRIFSFSAIRLLGRTARIPAVNR